MTAGITINTVHKTFGDQTALDGLSARIEAGRLTGLVGPDGAGKSTLMRMMAALMMPDRGRITVDGNDTADAASTVHAVCGYMPQSSGLYEDLSVHENMVLYARLRGLHGAERAATFERLLAFTRLGPFTGRLAGRLSGGMKQKLGLACALMARPRVLLLDEPSVGVDPMSRQDLWRMVNELAAEGMAVVWSTAYLDEAERCDAVLLLNEGRLAFAGPPGELAARVEGRTFRVTGIDDRRNLLADLLDLEPIRDGVIQGSSLRLVATAPADRAVIEATAAAAGGAVEATRPGFEDAFIDLLGGGPGGRSAIAERMDPVDLGVEAPVSCRKLTRRFGDFVATDNVSFDVKPGEIFGLLGPNGAGKSTTFKMLCGLLKPSAGSAQVAGLDLRHASSAAKQQLGYMAQKFSLYGLLTVRQNLELFAGLYQLSGGRKRRRIEEMMTTFELQPYLGRSPNDLPLGFKQRLALACSLMHRPAVLFLDEPTSGVDPLTRREFWTHINGLVRRGVTVLVTTHFMDEAEYCDRVAMMYRGRLIALAQPDALKARSATADTPDPTMEQAFIELIRRDAIAAEAA
ncbi:MAG: ATP-binding cassette domain-containing protein [Pseudomonadota bacterium]